MSRKSLYLLPTVAVIMSLIVGCAPQPTPVPPAPPAAPAATEAPAPTAAPAATEAPAAPAKLKVFGAFATPIEEPWDGAIHGALLKAKANGEIEYTFTENIGYAGDMERVLREACDKEKPNIIVGDAYGNEEAARRVAKDYPNIAFVFGSGGGPADPNFSVFDNWLQEPAYLAGMLAAGMSKSGTLGIVAAMPVPEVDRIVNAFQDGAVSINPKIKTKIAYINSFFDPAAAKEAALAQIAQGADVLYAERDGVIDAAKEKGVWAIGNMTDQSALAPATVLSSVSWEWYPTAEYVFKTVAAGVYTAQDLKDFSSLAKGGASLAPYHDNDSKIPADLKAKIAAQLDAIKTGAFRVNINDSAPIPIP